MLVSTENPARRPSGDPRPDLAFGVSLAAGAKAVLDANWTGSFTRPSPRLYPHQWNWDSGFIAIGYAGYSPERAMTELRSLFRGQWRNGMVPHIVFHHPSDTYFPDAADWRADRSPDAPDGVFTSGITQPPIHATAVRAVVERATRKLDVLRFLEEMYPKLLALHRFLYRDRDPDGLGLAVCVHPWETGIDNSPKWDRALLGVDAAGLPIPVVRRKDLLVVGTDQRPADDDYRRYIQLVDLFRSWDYDQPRMVRESPFQVYDVLFNSVLHRANWDLLELARVLGEPTAEIREWLRKTAGAFETHLWDEQDRMYHSRDLVSGQPIRVHTASCAVPLFAGVPDHARVERLVGGFFTACPFGEPDRCASVPSYHESQEGFQAVNYWRGPVWVNVNWMIYEGLRRYRLIDSADRIRRNLLRLAGQAGFWEYYHPTEPRGLGSPDFSWTAALVLDLLGRGGWG
ncbi:MAG: trehalase family glycosidase [Deferrisomatales bacterium]